MKKYFYESEIRKIFGSQASFGAPKFINNHTLMFASAMISTPNYIDITVTWDIFENSLKKVLNFETQSFDIKQGRLLLCSYFAALAILDTQLVDVKDSNVPNESFLKYSNNQLEYYSDFSFIGEPAIYDTTGKLIAKLGSQQFVIGKNIIRVNRPLQRGIYLLSIQNNNSQSSYKFIVE